MKPIDFAYYFDKYVEITYSYIIDAHKYRNILTGTLRPESDDFIVLDHNSGKKIRIKTDSVSKLKTLKNHD